MRGKIITALLVSMALTQCHSLRSDCEALQEREAAIAQEEKGEYFVGRRYYIPLCRFWAQLVMMDETLVHTPDRGPEKPLPNATFGTDQNVEYTIEGAYTGKKAYDPSTDQILPVFRPTAFHIRKLEPGFLFVPSEEYTEEYVSLRPVIMPKTEVCKQELAKP